ncbi:MAG: phosphatidylinositol mannoside acyltransferase [Actinomycetota bacterium]
MSESLKERLAYWTYAGAERAAELLPVRAGRRIFELGGRLAYRLMGGARSTVAGNFSRVLGSPADSEAVQATTREAFRLYARYWYETFRLRVTPREEFDKRMSYEGLEHFEEALSKGNGVIAVLPHMGNWDAAGHWLALAGYQVVSVAEELKPERLLELFKRHREELGVTILTLSSNGHVGKRLAEYLNDNWIVALIADRDLSGRGVEVEMFGGKRTLPAGPALLSVTTGAPILVCPVYTTDEGWFCRASAPIEFERTGNTRDDVRAATRKMAEEFERAIAAHPVDWHMFQPAW